MDNNKLLKELFRVFKNVTSDDISINRIVYNRDFINYVKGLVKDPSLDANIIFTDDKKAIYFNNPFKDEYDKLVQRNYDTNKADNNYNAFIKFIDKLKEIYNELSPSFDRLIELYDIYVKGNEIRIALANISNTKLNSQTGILNKFKKTVLTTEEGKNQELKEKRFEALKTLKLDTEKDLLEIENIIKDIKNRYESKNDDIISNSYKYGKDNSINNSYIYKYSTFLNHLDIIDKQIKDEYDRIIKDYNKNVSSTSEKIEMEPENLDPKKLKAIYDDALDKLNKYTSLKTPTENQQIEIKFALAAYKNLFDSDKGRWKKDRDDNSNYKQLIGLINNGKNAYDSLLLKTAPEETSITNKYEEAYNLYDALKVAAEKLKKKEQLSQFEYDIITNFNQRVIDLQHDARYKDEPEFREVIKKIRELNTELFTKEKIDEIKKKKDEMVRDPSKVYFADYVPIFKLSLSMLVYVSIVMVLFILLLSIVAFFKLIYDMIVNIISLFVNNDNSTRSLSLDYLSKTITRCTKSDFSDDRFYILTEQKQNLTIFNIGVYIVYLLLLYIFIYFILIIYSNVMDKTFMGSIDDIDKTNLFLFLLAVIISYSVIHLVIYKYIFKTYVYIPYKELDAKERKIDEKIASYILIYSNTEGSNESNDNILVDDEFFTILYDASRIDEIDEIFMDGVMTENKDNCLEQKIIIYNIYNYLREYTVFDINMQEKFKEYCTSDVDNKPKFTDSDIKMTFVSMMNNDEVKMIRKYNEELPYYNKIPDNKIEYFNKLNANINEKIKQINLLILTNTNTMIPFFLTILYIIFIVILNIIVFYVIALIVLSKDPHETGFNEYIFKLLYYIKTEIYDRIIKKFIGI